MRITTYRTELDENRLNVLVKENSFNYPPLEKISTAYDAVAVLNSVYRLDKQAEEHVFMIALSSNGKILGVFEISHGTINAALCNPRDILIRALLCGAGSFLLAHNHPSGDVTPSNDDMESHKRLSDSGELIGIKLLDELIIGEKKFYSFNSGSIHYLT